MSRFSRFTPLFLTSFLVLLSLICCQLFNLYVLNHSKSPLNAETSSIYQQKNTQLDYLFIGSSRMSSAIIPSVFEPRLVKVVGLPHMDIHMTYLVLEKYLSKSTSNTNLIVIEIDLESLYIDSLVSKEETKAILASFGIPFYKLRTNFVNLHNWQIKYFFPLLAQKRLTPRLLWSHMTYRLFKNYERKSETKNLPGIRNTILSVDKMSELSLQKQKHLEKLYTPQNEMAGISKLEKLVDLLRANNQYFCFLKLPVSKYINSPNVILSKTNLDRYYEMISKNWCSLNRDIYNGLLFSDPTHLHLDGAQLFSTRLAKQLSRNIQ
jgi:hypothetical protein